MARKTKKQRKRDERERRDAEEKAAEEAAQRRLRNYQIAAGVVPVITLAVSLAIYFAVNDRQLAALVGMVGLAVWVPLLLGVVGSRVKPRDRTRAGSIDFGNKR